MIVMIKESCNLIGQETQLAPPNQKYQSQILPWLDEKLYQKLRYNLILSRDINDKKNLQSDWAKGIKGIKALQSHWLTAFQIKTKDHEVHCYAPIFKVKKDTSIN